MRHSKNVLAFLVALLGLSGCSGLNDLKHDQGGGSGGGGGSSSITVSVTPFVTTLAPFGSTTLTAAVTGSTNTGVTWQVNGVTGGNSTTGIISTSGVFSAPHSIPASLIPDSGGSVTVTVTAISKANNTSSGSASIVLKPQQQSAQSGAVKLGTSGGNVNDVNSNYCCAGTLGSLLSIDGVQYILSNNHVLARSDYGIIGEAISQPGLIETNCSQTGTQSVANLSEFFNLEAGPNPKVDAAIAQVVSGKVDTGGNILLLGATTTAGVPDPGAPHAGSGVAPAVSQGVAKSGRTTGLTCSTVVATNVSSSVDYYRNCGDTTKAFTTSYTDLVTVAGGDFSAAGDSGSLIVTQSSADPVALLFAGSDTDSVGNPVSDVLAAFPGSSSAATFVGGAAHQVIGCSLVLTSASAKAKSLAAGAEAIYTASHVRDLHAPELLANTAIEAVGVGPSYDHPGQAAIVLFVNSRTASAPLPQSLDGVPTRILRGNSWSLRGMLTSDESAQLLREAGTPSVAYALTAAESQRALKAKESNATALFALPSVLGVGVSSSVDAPGEAALLVYVQHGTQATEIPQVLDGVRTRVRETSPFSTGRERHAGASDSGSGCRVRPVLPALSTDSLPLPAVQF